MHMCIDQPGHQYSTATIDAVGSGLPDARGGDLLDAAAFHDHGCPLEELCVEAVEDRAVFQNRKVGHRSRHGRSYCGLTRRETGAPWRDHAAVSWRSDRNAVPATAAAGREPA